MNFSTRSEVLWPFVATVALAAAGTVPAQTTSPSPSTSSGGLEEVVVTSTKRTESIQDIPIAVTAVSGDLLKNLTMDAGADLPKLTPNLTINSGSAFFSPYLRGIGTQYSNLGLESSVATYFDDIYYSRPQGGLASFNDIERVEVLKGPQGTLFGRNAAGGAIRIISKDPTFDLEGNAALTYGRYERTGVEGMINIPLGDSVATRFAYYHDERDGNIDNVDPDVPDSNNRDIDMLRGKILFKASDALSIKLSGDFTDKDDREGAEFINLEGAPTQLGVAIGGTPSSGFYKSTNDSDAQLRVKQAGGELRIDLDVGGTTVSSISGYRWSELKARGSDLDTVDLPFQHDDYTEASNSYSQELQAVSDKTGPLTWIAGLYYFRESGDNTFNVFGQAINASVGLPDGPDVGTLEGGAALNAKSEIITESFAPYVEGTYELTDQLRLTLGGRYTWENKKLEQNRVFLTGVVPGQQVPLFPPDGDRKLKFEKFSPKISLDWKPVSDVLLYVTYSRGFKSGGFNTPAFTPLVDSVEPETLDAYELGWKTEFGRVRFNGSVFYYDFKDLQIQRTDQTSGGTRVENAAAAEIYGIETDITLAITPALEVGVGGGLLKSEYQDYLGDAYVPAFNTQACIAAGGVVSGNPVCLGYAVEPRDFSGDTLSQAPEASAYVRAQYEIPLPGSSGAVRANALYSYTDRYFYNPEHSLAEPSKNIVSASVSWVSDSERFQLTAFGDNLLDEKYDILKVRQGTGGWHVPGLPRTWGVKLSAGF